MGNSYLPMGKINSETAPIVFQRTMYLPINASNHGLVEGHPNKLKPLKYSIVSS